MSTCLVSTQTMENKDKVKDMPYTHKQTCSRKINMTHKKLHTVKTK